MNKKDGNPKDSIGAAKWRHYMSVPRQVLWEIGIAMLEGAVKYGRHNYRVKGVLASVYLDAAMGHIDQFIEGEDIDTDSGLSHITKAITSLIVLRDGMMNDFWVDDRPPKIANIELVRNTLQLRTDELFEKYKDTEVKIYSEVDDDSGYKKNEI